MSEDKLDVDLGMEASWGMAMMAAVCEQCDWRYLVFEPDMHSECPRCHHPRLSPVHQKPENLPYFHPPELLVPYSLSSQLLDHGIQNFARGIPFAPRDLTLENLSARLRRLYLPMWLVDCDVNANWQAELGFDYKVVSHQDQYNQARGGWTSHQVEEKRVRWEPRHGRLKRTYHNVTAPALEGDQWVETMVGQYNTAKAQAFRPDAISKAAIRLPDREPRDAWEGAKPGFYALASEECRQAGRGDHIRQFSWKPEFGTQHWTLLLLPMYTTHYVDDDNRPQRVFIHGQTGFVRGERRASMKRAQRISLILVALAVAAFVVSVGISAGAFFLPALLAVGAFGLAISLVFGLGAVYPIAAVWWFNRENPHSDS